MPGRRREEAVSHSRGRVKEASPAGAGSRQTTATAEPSLVAHQTGRGRNLAGIAPTKRAATVTSARKEDAPGSSRPEERRTPEGREERARGSNHQCVPKWRIKAVEWSNQRASPHGTSGDRGEAQSGGRSVPDRAESEERVDEEEERHKDRRCTQLASDCQSCQHRGGDEVTAHSPRRGGAAERPVPKEKKKKGRQQQKRKRARSHGRAKRHGWCVERG